MPFEDQDILNKIHLNYRLIYLKDTALATGLDESNLQIIGNLISNNNSEVVQSILLDQDNITTVFEKLQDRDIYTRKEAISFLSEIFTISKSLQMQGRLNLMTSFKNIEGFNLSVFVRQWFNFKDDIVSSADKTREKLEEADKLITNWLDILQNYLQSFPVSISDLCNENKTNDESDRLLSTLADHMLKCDSQGLKLQIHELLKSLLENDQNLGTVFYEAWFKWFAEFLPKPYDTEDREEHDLVDLTKSLILDIVNRCISEDNYNCKGYIDKYDFLVQVNKMALWNSKIQNMWILKFYKCLIMTNFKPYVNEMIKLNLCDVIVDIYDKIINKRNMIGSIALELFLMIDKKEHYDLAKHLWDKYEIVQPYLSKAADKYQPKVSLV